MSSKKQNRTRRPVSSMTVPSYSLADADFSKINPSTELLTYYRQKIIDLNNEHEETLEKVEQCTNICNYSFQVEQELQRRNAEVARLQAVVSDLQIFLYQEREQVLQLHAENDMLKIRDHERSKKIQLLCFLSGIPENQLKYYIIDLQSDNPVPKLPPREQKLQAEGCTESTCDLEVLTLQVKSISRQLEDKTCIFRDQIQSLLQDRDLCRKERTTERERLEEHISTLSMRLKETQDKLCKIVQELVTSKKDNYLKELNWIEEKNRLLLRIKCSCNKNDLPPYSSAKYRVAGGGIHVSGIGNKPNRTQLDLDSLKDHAKQQDLLVTFYQDQCSLMEKEILKFSIQTETIEKKFKENIQKMASEIVYLKSKYNHLDRRRQLEAEGFRTDVKLLRGRLQDLERKLSKAVLALPSVIVAAQETHSKSANMKKKTVRIERELQSIKNKISSIENNLISDK